MMNIKHKLLTFTGYLVGLAVAWAVLASGSTAQADGFTSQRELLPPPKNMRDDPQMPPLKPADKAYLMKFTRQALEYSVQTGKLAVPKDVPESLKDKDCIVYVAVRQVGHLVESSVGEGHSLLDNIAHAALFVAGSKEFAVKEPAGKESAGAESPGKPTAPDKLTAVRGCTIELNILGPGQALQYAGEMIPGPNGKPDSRVMSGPAQMIVPGVHGLSARITTWEERDTKKVPVVTTITLKESVAPTHNYTSELVLYQLIQTAGWTPDQVTAHHEMITFFRFRSVHLLEQPGADGYVELFRCAPVIAVDQVTRPRLDELINSIGHYVCYRQIDRTGLFSYCYSPTDGAYLKGDNAPRQAGAAWAMARMAQIAPAEERATYELAALKAIAGAKIRYLDPPGTQPSDPPGRTQACVGYAFEPGQESLGATALMLCALADVPNNKAVVALRDKVAAGVLHQQQADGSFSLYYYPHDDPAGEAYYPGEALLALMKMHQQTGEKKYLDAVEKSFACYHKLFQEKPDRGFAPWHAQAWAMAFDATGKKEYRDFVLQLGDYLVGFQADDIADIYPDMVGAFVSEDGTGGVGSASFLEGVAAAHRVAVKAGDAKRTKKYENSLRLGARFLDQLTFKKADAYYCVTPKDVIGGLKTSPNNHTIRIDNCQHGLMALIGIRDQLFPVTEKPK